MKQNKITVSVSNRTMLQTVFWIVGTLVAFLFISRITHALTLIFISFFLALALNPVVKWMSDKLNIKNRIAATAAAYLTVIVTIGVFFFLVTPPLISQGRDFVSDLPQIVADFQAQDNSIGRAIDRFGLDEKLTNGARDFASHYSNYGSTLLDTGKRVAGVFVSALVILAMTFMMLAEGPRWLDRFFELMPKSKRSHHRALSYRMYRAVSGFVNAQVILAVLAGTFCLFALTIATSLLNVSVNVVALAGIVAMLGLIPMIGHPISSAVVILVCLSNSAALAIIMLIYFLVYYQVENLTVQPIIQSRLNELTPLLVFVAAIIGVEFAGILGAFVAIPIATCVKILLEDQLEKNGIRPTKQHASS